MSSIDFRSLKRPLATIGVSLLFGAGVGILLTILGSGGSLVQNVVISLCIAFAAAAVPLFLKGLLPLTNFNRLLLYAAGIPIGVLTGATVLVFWVNPDTETFHKNILTIVLVTLLIGGSITALFYLHGRRRELEDNLQAAKLRQVEAERSTIEAQLKMLQAQIEPHFLFNTLANVAALVSADPPLARRLLDHLIVYLRAALARTRADAGTLGDEIELLRTYLEICRIRMGERLRYRLDIPPELLTRPFPPMLLQPLVENAVKHGLEPKLTVGEIRIAATHGPSRLRIAVTDDGVGFGDPAGNGTGIANVNARLAAIYGAAATLTMEANAVHGVTAALELPA